MLRSYRVVAAAVLVLGLLGSVLYAKDWAGSARSSAEQSDQAEIDATIAQLQAGFDRYERALNSEKALLAASGGHVSFAAFQTFYEAMNITVNFPGMQGMGLVRVVADHEQAAFVAAARADGRPGFALAPPGVRPESYVMLYNEPSAFLGTSWGYDIGTNPTMRPSMERASDTGEASLSGKAVLSIDLDLPVDEQPVGLAMWSPIYETGADTSTVQGRRAGLEGFVSTPFRAQDFLSYFVGAGSTMGVQLFDSSAAAENLLAASPPGFSAAGETTTATLEVGGRSWVALFGPLPGTPPATYWHGPAAALTVGVALSAMLAALLWMYGARAQHRAETAFALASAAAEMKLSRDEAVSATRAKS